PAKPKPLCHKARKQNDVTLRHYGCLHGPNGGGWCYRLGSSPHTAAESASADPRTGFQFILAEEVVRLHALRALLAHRRIDETFLTVAGGRGLGAHRLLYR